LRRISAYYVSYFVPYFVISNESQNLKTNEIGKRVIFFKNIKSFAQEACGAEEIAGGAGFQGVKTRCR